MATDDGIDGTDGDGVPRPVKVIHAERRPADRMPPEHRVRVDSGKYTFVIPAGGTRVEILRHGEPWHDQELALNAMHSIMCELDAARIVIEAARKLAADLPALEPIAQALRRHEALVSDREPPSAWAAPATAPSTAFDIPRHNDHTYNAPVPWGKWDTYAGCWTCDHCGAAAGYQLHNGGCPHADAVSRRIAAGIPPRQATTPPDDRTLGDAALAWIAADDALAQATRVARAAGRADFDRQRQLANARFHEENAAADVFIACRARTAK